MEQYFIDRYDLLYPMEPMTLGSPVGSPAHSPGTPGTNANYLPGFLLGDTNTSARLGVVSPQNSSRYMGTPGSNYISPVSNYGTPDYRNSRQKAMFGNVTSPTGQQIGSEGHMGGPPTKGLFDTYESANQSITQIVPAAHQDIGNQSRLLSGNLNSSLMLETPVNYGLSDSSQGVLLWVTVFGFPPNALNPVLSHISSRARVVDRHNAPHTQSNWIHLKCASEQEVQKALACNGNIVSGSVMIGVMPCMDEGVVLGHDKENRAKINGSMRIFSPTKPQTPTTEYNTPRSPARIQNARPLAAGFNQHLSPQSVTTPTNVPQKSTGLVSRTMDYIFGW